jgi:hypothetical protein
VGRAKAAVENAAARRKDRDRWFMEETTIFLYLL